MNSIYITADGLSDPLGQSQIMPYLDSYLLKKEDHLYVVSLEKKNIHNKNIFSTDRIIWKYKYFLRTRHFKFINLLKLFFLTSLILLTEKRKINIIHCRGLYPCIIGLFFKLTLGKKLIFDMRGLWVDEKVDAGLMNINKSVIDKFLFLVLKRIEEVCLFKSDCIIVLTKKIFKHFCNNIKIKKKKIFIIPCSVDYKIFNQLKKNTSKNYIYQELNIKKKYKIITYSGSLGSMYRLDIMLLFFSNIRKIYKNYIFLFITNDLEILRKKLNEKKYRNLATFIRFKSLSWQQVPSYLSLSEFTLCFVNPTYAKIASFPTKIAESFSLGIPVICNDEIGDLKQIFKGKLGLSSSIDSFKEEINVRKFIKKIKMCNKKNIIAKTIKVYDLNVAKRNYKKIYNDISKTI